MKSTLLASIVAVSAFAKNVADRVVFMDHDEIVEVGPPDDIFGAPKSLRLKDFLRHIRTS